MIKVLIPNRLPNIQDDVESKQIQQNINLYVVRDFVRIFD